MLRAVTKHGRVSLLGRGLLREMSQPGPELPIAPTGCTLDDGDLVAQLDRYRRLGATALSIETREREVVISFGGDVDLELLAETGPRRSPKRTAY